MLVTHKDNNGLDNRRSNLHSVALPKEVTRHARKWDKPLTSTFKGVCWIKEKSKWCSKIVVDRKHIHLGYCDSEIEAARNYDEAARKYFNFPHLNFPDTPVVPTPA